MVKTKNPRLTPNAAISFRTRLREARATALEDAEGYATLVNSIEALGAFLSNNPNATGLGAYATELIKLARFASSDTSNFASQLDALRGLRNDNAHLGAVARRATSQATAVALTLEDALAHAENLHLVDHFMIEGPTCAEQWQTLGLVRAIMLRGQYSALPYRHNSEWHLVTDAALVLKLSKDRKTRLHDTISEAVASDNGLQLVKANTAVLGAEVATLTRLAPVVTTLVVDSNQNLRGIITPFDLL